MDQPEGVPITIGVIGHLDAYRLDYQQSRFHIISALAEGADQIAVEACQGVADLDVLALLPMPLDEYENDFISTSSLEEFRSQLNRANYTSDLQSLAPYFCYESRSNAEFSHN